jgi:hypothetical protein
MNTMGKILWSFVAGMLILAGCAPEPPRYVSLQSQELPPQEREGQIPAKVLEDASQRYSGAMKADEIAPETAAQGIQIIIGPIQFERMTDEGPTSADAGQEVREILTQEMTRNQRITLVDAPEERLIDDAPRPDLANRGIQYVLKGTASASRASGKISVFLRMVATSSGEVAYVASGQSMQVNEAVMQAAQRLMTDIQEGPKP